jgi:RNase H-like domain found in reverse transcriptase
MPQPTTGADLQQFTCALNWMRSAIPDFARLISPLTSLLERVYARSGARTRAAAKRISLSEEGWDTVHDTVFSAYNQSLIDSCRLSHRDTNKPLCLYTDASEHYWASILTQVHPQDL